MQPGVLALFRKLACVPGRSDTAWQSEIGYQTSSDWDNPNAQTVSCDRSGDKYALAEARVLGQDVTSAAAMPSPVANQWAVDLTLNRAGASAFAELTADLHSKHPTAAGNQNDMTLDQVAIVVDGAVISAPETEGAITGGEAQIMGNFTRASAQELAAQLQSGPLPAAFQVTGTTIHAESASGQAPAS